MPTFHQHAVGSRDGYSEAVRLSLLTVHAIKEYSPTVRLRLDLHKLLSRQGRRLYRKKLNTITTGHPRNDRNKNETDVTNTPHRATATMVGQLSYNIHTPDNYRLYRLTVAIPQPSPKPLNTSPKGCLIEEGIILVHIDNAAGEK